VIHCSSWHDISVSNPNRKTFNFGDTQEVTESVLGSSEWHRDLLHTEVEAKNCQAVEGLDKASETDWIHEEEGLREFIVGKVDDLARGC